MGFHSPAEKRQRGNVEVAFSYMKDVVESFSATPENTTRDKRTVPWLQTTEKKLLP